MQKNQAKSQTHRYRYSLSNPVTGLKLTREFSASSNEEAKQRVKHIARCFGKSTVIEKLARLKEE